MNKLMITITSKAGEGSETLLKFISTKLVEEGFNVETDFEVSQMSQEQYINQEKLKKNTKIIINKSQLNKNFIHDN